MNDWKEQLKGLYAVHRDKEKSKKLTTEKSKFDSVVGWKGKKGFSSTGAALTAHAAKQQQKNKASYRYRYQGSRLEQINKNRQDEAAAKHGLKKISSSLQQDGVVIDKPIQDYRPKHNGHSSSGSFFIGRVPNANGDDDGSVEINLDHARTSSDFNEPTFKSKVEESIYRLKLENLKKR